MRKKRPFYHLLLLCLLSCCHSLRAQQLELWHSQQAGYVIDQVIARFNQESGHQVRALQFEPDKIKADILLAAQAKGLPDLMLVPSDFIGLYQQMRLSPIPEEWFSSELMNNALHYVTLDARRWGMPMMQGNHLMLFYNKALVSAPVTRWQQLAAITPALKAKGVYPVSWPYNDMYYFAAFLHTFGGTPVSKGRITLDTPAMVQALEAYRTVASEQWIDPDCDYDTALTRFNEGKSAYLINGDWAFNDLVKNMGDQLGVALLPDWQTRPMHSMSGAYVITASRSSMEEKDRRDAIQALLTFIQRQDIQQFIYQQGALLPVNQQAFTTISRHPTPLAKVLLEQFTVTIPMPSDSAMSIAWQAMDKGFERFKEGLSAPETARYMQQLADQQYRQVTSP
ncbi:extracellular solute-binding protein [Aeromonas sobria]|uniref:Sugar ABC transporter substrate-binding protein n=1 Tax=Aeromonas sobria TaxID=646 RepID=A0A1S2CWY3_AERSO|nr:extracellular solute-binding protein [Aeromonas sobria]MBS4686664.1 extracellular solute-binding protein [Aeromonas sobria]OHY93222.1 sugar ABC transporter substrate-binding protein [Aeromonas sobria]